MTKIIISCKETSERRIFENCQTLVNNLPWLHEKVNLFSGDWQNPTDSLHVSITSSKAFHELISFIELTIADTWIIIDIGSQILSTFNKTPDLSKKWKDITFQARLYGAKVYGNTLAFKKNSNDSAYKSASAFMKRFCDLYF